MDRLFIGAWCGRICLALLLTTGLASAGVARAEGIVEVLQRSQAQRLAQRPAADPSSPAAARVQASFARLLAMLPDQLANSAANSAANASPDTPPARVQLVGGPLYAEALFGQPVVAVSESVGDLPEGERLMLLAHELGHLRLLHWQALSGLYLAHIPGEVRPETTEPAASALGAQAHLQSHRHEYEADAFGFALVRRLGFGVDTATKLLLRQGLQADSATHPGTRRRVAQLRSIEAVQDQALRGGGEAAAVAVWPKLP